MEKKKNRAGFLDNMEEQNLVLRNLTILRYRMMATDGKHYKKIKN